MVISSSFYFQLGQWFLSFRLRALGYKYDCLGLQHGKGFAWAEITFHLSLFSDAVKQPLVGRLLPLLDPWAAGAALNRNFWADLIWLFAFFCPPPFFSSYPFTTTFQRGAIFIDVFVSFLWNCNIWRWLQRDTEPYAQPDLYKHCPGWQPFLAHLQLPGNPLFFWSLGRKSSWASLLLGKCNWLYHTPSFACHNYRSLTPLCYL